MMKVVSGPTCPAGEVEVLAQAEAFSTGLRRVFAPARGVTLVLAPGAEIIGRVVDAEEQPVAGLNVRARGTHDHEELRLATKSDAAGEFRIAGVPGGGSYEVMATGPTFQSDARQVPVEIGRSSDPVLLRVQRATALTGRVQRSGEPCAGAHVSASGPSAAATRASASGVVRLDGLLPGSYRVAVYCSEALPLFESIELGDQPLHRDWAVLPGLSVQGTVLNAAGEPVPNASIGCRPLSDSSDKPSTTCGSSAGGAFTCSGLVPGDYLCAVNDRGDPDRELVHVALGRGSAVGVVLRTRPHASIAVSLVPPRPDMGTFRVFARGPSGFPLQATLEHGRFMFNVLPFGFSEESETRERAGSLGGVVAGHLSMWPQVLDAVEALEPGAVSKVVATEYGYHVLHRRPPIPEAVVSGAHIVIAHADAPWLQMAASGAVPARSRQDAQALAARVAAEARATPGDFAALVAKYSEHRDAARGGDFGSWSTHEPAGYPREIKTLAGLAIGEIAGPIDTRFGFQIIQRTENRPRQHYAMTKLQLRFDTERTEPDPASKPVVFQKARALAKSLQEDPARFGPLQQELGCPEVWEVIEGRELPALEVALEHLAPGQIAKQPIEDGEVEYLIPKRLHVGLLPPAPKTRFELAAN